MQLLNYKVLGEGAPMIILHGLFGSLDNWLTAAKSLAEDYKVFMVDQRNHGQSFHSEDFSYEAMARDLQFFVKEMKINNPILLGHSMGGKTILKYTSLFGDDFSKMIVVDIAPKAYPVHHQSILDAYHAVDLQKVERRSDAEDQLKPLVKNVGIRQFLLKNLNRDKDGRFSWKINLPVIEENIEEVGEGLPDKQISEKPVLFIRGENSDYIKDEDISLIKSLFPNANLVTIKNAGHWIHAEQPDAFLQTVQQFLVI